MSAADDFGHTAFAEARRMEKAAALAARLHADGIPAAAVPSLPPASRRRVERAAGVRRSSAETWAKAAEVLEDRERRTA